MGARVLRILPGSNASANPLEKSGSPNGNTILFAISLNVGGNKLSGFTPNLSKTLSVIDIPGPTPGIMLPDAKAKLNDCGVAVDATGPAVDKLPFDRLVKKLRPVDIKGIKNLRCPSFGSLKKNPWFGS